MNSTNNLNYNTSFGSTLIPFSNRVPVRKILKELEPSFELKSFKNAEDCKKLLDYGQAGLFFDKEGLRIQGREKSADEFIFNRLKDFSGAKYINDGIALENPKTGFNMIA